MFSWTEECLPWGTNSFSSCTCSVERNKDVFIKLIKKKVLFQWIVGKYLLNSAQFLFPVLCYLRLSRLFHGVEIAPNNSAREASDSESFDSEPEARTDSLKRTDSKESRFTDIATWGESFQWKFNVLEFVNEITATLYKWATLASITWQFVPTLLPNTDVLKRVHNRSYFQSHFHLDVSDHTKLD